MQAALAAINKILSGNRCNFSTDKAYPYESLAPITNADSDGEYSKALEWALHGPESERIRNIALTGPYGSGKSSIIRTFFSRKEANRLKYLSISLATFKDEKKASPCTISDDIQKQIEISVLQQIFYHEEQENIPDSRLKRIRSLSRKRQLSYWLLLLFAILAASWIAGEGKIVNYIGITIPQNIKTIIRYVSIAICFGSSARILHHLVRQFSGISLSKFKIHDAEFEIGKDTNKSILNAHIDEILYFFEVTNYSIVVIEDLDRFDQTEVFTKLREINALINNAESINRNIRFIYCVRDELFENKDRTKFFEFIIPVIPIVNASNSKDILVQQVRKHGHKISTQVIEDLSLFVDEMRLLHNITNEFNIYKSKLNETLSQEKLFAIICYKNLYPHDFTCLPRNEGALYSYFILKQEKIASRVAKISADIEDINNSIQLSNSNKELTLSDLRKVYSYSCITNAFQNYHNQNGINFIINGAPVSPNDIHNEVHFDAIANDNYTIRTGIGNTYPPQIKFRQIEEAVAPNRSYAKRKDIIENSSREQIEIKKNKISELRAKREKTRSASIRSLLEEGVEFNTNSDHQHRLIELLLREGYVEEDYISYISIFHEGTLTRSDYDFLLRVKTRRADNFSHKLFNTFAVFERLTTSDFRDSSALNYDLIDFAITSKNEDDKTTALLSQLNLDSQLGSGFINSYIQSGRSIDLFVTTLAKRNANFWNFIENESNYPHELKLDIFMAIVQNCDSVQLNAIANSSNFKNYYETVDAYEFFVSNTTKIKSDISMLGIKFENISSFMGSGIFLEIILELNAFAINVINCELLFNHLCKVPELVSLYNVRNFEAISSLDHKDVFEYLTRSINDYVENVYLKIPSNTMESVSHLAKLLNNSEITRTNASAAIDHVTTKIIDIHEIENLEICELLAKQGKMGANWIVIAECFSRSESVFPEWLVEFINNQSICKEIALTKLSNLSLDNETKIKVAEAIVYSDVITDDSFSILAPSLGYVFSSLKAILSDSRTTSLANCKALKLTQSNIANIFKNNQSSFGYFIQSNIDSLLDPKESITLALNEISALFEYKELQPSNIALILNHEKYQALSNESEIINKLASRIEAYSSWISESYMVPILGLLANDADRFLPQFNEWAYKIDPKKIPALIQAMPHPYHEIAQISSQIQIPTTEVNRKFAQTLKSLALISNYSTSKSTLKLHPFKNHT